MKRLLIFIQKEFYHVFRDSKTLMILFGIPIIQIVLFGYALNSEVKNIGIAVLDNSHDVNTIQITNKISQSPYFHMRYALKDYKDIEAHFRDGSLKCALVFPANFANDLRHVGKATVQVIVDGSDPNTATSVNSYISAIMAAYQQEINATAAASYTIVPEVRQLFNEDQNGSLVFIPGVIALIFMMVSTALTSVSVVREKELGTMEILLVSPFKPLLVLVAKAVPYLVLSLVDFIIILILSVVLLDVHIMGSLVLLFMETVLFITTCLALGLLISNITNSQQTAMLVSMMGMMLPTVLLTGFLTPLENMPEALQAMSYFVPSRYYYFIVKAVMLKGLSFTYVWKETLILVVMATGLMITALKNFKIRLA